MPDTPKKPSQKHSYTVPCSKLFRDEVTRLANKKKCNVADLARSVVLLVPMSVIELFPDPGEPVRDERETVILKSGRSMGKPWRRKPRLQVRLASGFTIEVIRKALGLALSIGCGDMNIGVKTVAEIQDSIDKQQTQEKLLRDVDVSLRKSHEDHAHLETVVKTLYFDPLPGGVHTREQALFVLGFPPGEIPDKGVMRQRFRRLATVYHPDGKNGCHQRMSQLNAAMEIFRS